MRTWPLWLLMAASLTQCAPPAEEKGHSGMQAGHLSETAAPYAYQVRIRLTPRAVKTLAAANERIMFSAWYFGFPTPATRHLADDMNRISFNSYDVMHDLAADQTFTVRDKAIDAAGLGYIGNAPYLNINVYSSRLHTEDNLLNCSIFEDRISVAMKTTIAIQCDALD